MKEKKKRTVRIVTNGDTHFVQYVDRHKGQRWCAARFYAPDHTREQVAAWVKGQAHLELVD